MTTSPPALLVLEDGSAFRGRGFGAEGEALGEAVFNTAMAGYQEVLTDPSYLRQIVVMTAPHQGNYGVNPEDAEAGSVRVAGFAVREAGRRVSSWRAAGSLREHLAAAGVVGVEGIDTRAVTLRLREQGAMRAGVSTVDLDAGSLLERVRCHPGMEGADLAVAASTPVAYQARELVGPARAVDGGVFRVAAYDFGLKRNILRLLGENGCEVTVVPARTPAQVVLSSGFDGAFLSNGPGDPAATTYGVEAARALLGRIPLFGICLGHQLIGLALGARSYKLRFGHRGVNQPVKDLETGRVEITSHNHGFAVDPDSFGAAAPPARGSLAPEGAAAVPRPGSPALSHAKVAPSIGVRDRLGVLRGSAPPSRTAAPVMETRFGRVALTHWNMNDGTLEGLRCLDVPALSVQYHPEAAPGPHDAGHLFARFRELMS